LRREVIRRANLRCEYCLIHQNDAASSHQVDHIVAVKHGGATDLDNLALSCLTCNRRKASDIGAADPATGDLVRLYHPRTQEWSDHFYLDGAEIFGRTADGRATIEFLQLNSPLRVLERRLLIKAGRYPAGLRKPK
jgi:hypothetical protein